VNRFLLDTSAYAAFMRGHPHTVAAIRQADEITLSATVLGEMLAGFMSGGQRKKNEAELARFLESPRVSLIDVDEQTAERYAVIFTTLRAAGTPIPTNDLWIAASAMQHGLRLLTLDAHFQQVPQILTHFISA
jgi:tRNA(fMet)-specific endonuclease VapC